MKRKILFFKWIFIKSLLSLKHNIGIKNTIFKLKSGEALKIRNIDNLGSLLINGESFEDRTRMFIEENVKDGMVVIDIGANIGYYTVKMSSLVGSKGKVLAFEPNPRMISELRGNIELNKIKNTDIFTVALSDSAGSMPFCMPKIGNEAHGSLRKNNTFSLEEVIEVKVDTLDEVLHKNKIDRVDLIKIDVEGSEYEVLSGARNLLSSKNKPIIIFESAENLVGGFGHKVFDVLKLVADCGYEIENIDWGNWIARPIKK